MTALRIGIIAGTGIAVGDLLAEHRAVACDTAFGTPSAALAIGRFAGVEVAFLARHGHDQAIPPHRINYRANIQALRDHGVNCLFAFAAVGGIHALAVPGGIVIPDQIIDYTTARSGTFYDAPGRVDYVDFTWPYSTRLRAQLLAAAAHCGVDILGQGVYGATQGPRLETAAEVRRLQQDGCAIVGMTGMPEAALAREVGIDYATIAIVANRAAGLTDEPITQAGISASLRAGQARALSILRRAVERLVIG